MSDTPIADHALLSDCHSAALVDRAGSVVWWCVPRFDSPSVFARLLDPRAGQFTITPVGVRRSERRYLDGTLILESRFRSDDGELVVTEALAMADGVRGTNWVSGRPTGSCETPDVSPVVSTWRWSLSLAPSTG